MAGKDDKIVKTTERNIVTTNVTVPTHVVITTNLSVVTTPSVCTHTTNALLQLPITTSTGTLPKNIKSPSEYEPRTSWIYGLNRAELEIELKSCGLSTVGKMDDLRKIFVKYIRSQDQELAGAGSTNELANTDNKDRGAGFLETVGCFTGPPAMPFSNTSFTQLNNTSGNKSIDRLQLENIKEMLGLDPNTDFETLKRMITFTFSQGQFSGRNESEVLNVPKPPTATTQPNTNSESCTSENVNNTDTYQQSVGKIDRQETHKTATVAELCNIVRKWNLRFDGQRDAISFMERLHELIEAYGIRPDSILKALPELLKDQALLWQRNNKDLWNTFTDFERDFESQYLPPSYKLRLDDEIRRRTQGDQELVKQYVVAISTLIRRRGGYSETERLERIYMNMRPEYRLYVKRKDFTTIGELVRLAEEYEACLKSRQTFNPPPNPTQALVPETAYQQKRGPSGAYRTATLDEIRPERSWRTNAVKGRLSPSHNYQNREFLANLGRNYVEHNPDAPWFSQWNEKPISDNRQAHGSYKVTNRPSLNENSRGIGGRTSPGPKERTEVSGNKPRILDDKNMPHERNGRTPNEHKTVQWRDSTLHPKPRDSGIRCYKCRESGHYARECTAPTKIYCYGCGTKGVRVSECSCKQGNEHRTLEQRGPQSPSQK